MIYAEKIHIGHEQGYNDIVYAVYNGDTVGTYRILIAPTGRPYGAGRDVHRLATEADYAALDDEHSYVSIVGIQPCEFHGDKPCVCDGSSLVEVTEDDQRAFEIAAMMAQVKR